MAALCANLPLGSSLLSEYDADASWTRDQALMALLVNHMKALMYSMTPKKDRGPEPQMVGPSYMTEGQRRSLEARAMPTDELLRALAKPRMKKNRARG